MNTKNDFSLTIPFTNVFLSRLWLFLSGKKFQIHKAEVVESYLIIRIAVYYIDTDELVDYLNEYKPSPGVKASIKIYEKPYRKPGKPGRKKKVTTGTQIPFEDDTILIL